MKDAWVALCKSLTTTEPTFWSTNRAIHRGVQFKIEGDPLDSTITMKDGGYTASKMKQLERNYYHGGSHAAGAALWHRRVEQRKYGSVSFTCFNHIVKGHDIKTAEDVAAIDFEKRKSKIASVFGPCLQSVVLTLLPSQRAAVDIFYRTTEVYKKFPADLVFIKDVLLPGFHHEECPIVETTFHFSNLTVHPMYWVVYARHLEDPVAELDRVKALHPKLFTYIIKQTSRYLIPKYHRGIEKHSQSMSVHNSVHKLWDAKKLKEVEAYCWLHHPEEQ